MVLQEGVIEGRKVFGNITKYIKMGASSNFGNMFSVLGASIFLPFLPMLPIQVLTNNLLYDFSQTAIPTDNVDEDYLTVPRKWDIGNIFKFMCFIGPISSIFDYATFFTMLYVFDCWNNPSLFQTGWFVESLADADAHHPHHPDREDPVSAKPRQRGPDRDVTAHLRGRHCAAYSVDRTRRLKFTPLPPLYWAFIIAASFDLRSPDAFGENLVCPPLGHVKAGPARQVAETTRASFSLTAFTNVSSATSSGGITLSPVRTRPGRAD